MAEFVELAFGLKIPAKVVTPGHRPPFRFVSDLFFERTKNALGFANRSGSKTLSVALLNFIDMLFKPGCEIASAGAVRDQADKCYRYFTQFCQLPWFLDLSARYHSITGRPFFDPKDQVKAHTDFGNGSRLEVITGSEKGLRGPHPHKARIDEIDLIEWSVLQTGLSMAHSGNGIRGQNVFTSTRQYAQGSMQQLLETAAEKGIEVYQWNVWEILEECPRRCHGDPEHGDCPIYAYCRGKAHNCAGYLAIDDFVDKVRLLDKDSWETEWENKKPARHKLVYHMLGNHHIMTPERLRELYGFRSPSLEWYRIASVDFGSSPGHPFVFLILVQLPDGAWLLATEYVAEQRLLRDHASAIRSNPFWHRSLHVFCDWDAQDRIELKAHGINTRPARKGHGSVLTGIDYVSELLNGYPPSFEPRLYIWHECKYSFKELGLYSWRIGHDGQPDKSGNPEKQHDHISDALRMALFSYKHTARTRYRGRNMSGI